MGLMYRPTASTAAPLLYNSKIFNPFRDIMYYTYTDNPLPFVQTTFHTGV